MIKDFLPVSRSDMEKRGWEQCDFVYITGDAYVDHSSFGHAIISRVLESFGYKVGIIPQPDWKDKDSITLLGKPRLGFLVTAGNMDSMVNHYTVNKKRRHTDAYSPGGKMGMRPDYATIVYCNLIKQTYKDVPIIIGGIESSLRRLAHYDYWSDKVKHSILIDSGADLLLYGMGEKSVVEVADALDSGMDVSDITYVKGTVYKAKDTDSLYDYIELPDYDEVSSDKISYAKSFKIQHENTDAFTAKTLVEKYKNKCFVVQNPPAEPLTTMEMDDVYALPYMRNYHPMYEKQGGIPALSEIKFSITSNRGCFGKFATDRTDTRRRFVLLSLFWRQYQHLSLFNFSWNWRYDRFWTSACQSFLLVIRRCFSVRRLCYIYCCLFCRIYAARSCRYRYHWRSRWPCNHLFNCYTGQSLIAHDSCSCIFLYGFGAIDTASFDSSAHHEKGTFH